MPGKVKGIYKREEEDPDLISDLERNVLNNHDELIDENEKRNRKRKGLEEMYEEDPMNNLEETESMTHHGNRRLRRVGEATEEDFLPKLARKYKDPLVGGVTWVDKLKKWHAFMKISTIDYMIGYYDSEEEARSKLTLTAMPEHYDTLLAGVNEMQDNHMKRIFFSEYIHDHIDSNRKVNKSSHKGVSWSERDKKWIAQITLNGMKFHIGSYDDEECAKVIREVVHNHKENLLNELAAISDRKSKLKVFADYVHENCNSTRSIPTSIYEGIHATSTSTGTPSTTLSSFAIGRKISGAISDNNEIESGMNNELEIPNRCWHACVRILNERYRLGSYDSEEKAHNMLQTVKQPEHIKHFESVFPTLPERCDRLAYFAKYINEHFDPTRKLSNRKTHGRTSAYDGIYKTIRNYEKNEKSIRWRAAIRIFGDVYNVGTYDTEAHAFEMLSIVKSSDHYQNICSGLELYDNRKDKLGFFANYVHGNIDSSRSLKVYTRKQHGQHNNNMLQPNSLDMNSFLLEHNVSVDINSAMHDISMLHGHPNDLHMNKASMKVKSRHELHDQHPNSLHFGLVNDDFEDDVDDEDDNEENDE